MRGDFITTRVRRIRSAANPSADPTNIPDSDVPALRAQLQGEIGLAVTACDSIRARVEADDRDKKLLSLSDPRDNRRRMKNSYKGILPGGLTGMLARLVRSIVWRAVAGDAALLTPGRLDDLHFLVDRRLRLSERMLYDAGGPPITGVSARFAVIPAEYGKMVGSGYSSTPGYHRGWEISLVGGNSSWESATRTRLHMQR